MLSVNDLFKVTIVNEQESSESGIRNESIERILWIDEGGVICYTIEINRSTAMPVKRSFTDLNQQLDENLITLHITEPFASVYQSEEKISIKSKQCRDQRWELIKTLINDEPRIYEPDWRGKMIREEMEKNQKSKSLYYKYLTQYWQRGKIKNALLPDYFASGGKGKEKKMTDTKNGRQKRSSAETGNGIVVDDAIKKVFHISVKRYYHLQKENALRFTYEQMLRQYFNDGFYTENGTKKPILKNNEEIPSFRQFEYWYKKNYLFEEKMRARVGDRKFELDYRAVLGTSVGEMFGPGTKFQIDSTVADVYIVSAFNRSRIIGRPIIYVVIDVYSRMVVGLYVGLEGPSWAGAMMAIANTASDKVAFCKEYGIDIIKEDWPCNHLPQTFLADRGEMAGKKIDKFLEAFNINIQNTAPYRADWKGIVEQHFKTIHTSVKPFLPGSIFKDFRVRGGKDYRLDASLTMEEFTQVIIHCTLHHNNYHWLNQYNQSEAMISNDVKLTPKEIWHWGIKNRSGKLKTYPENIVKLHLLPTAFARVNRHGIEFKKMRYLSPKSVSQKWFSQARQKTWRIEISYDPRDMSKIYLHNQDGSSFESAELIKHHQKYNKKTLEEIELQLAYQSYEYEQHLNKERQKKSDMQSEIENIVEEASRQVKKDINNDSDRQRVKGIRKNGLVEKEANRKKEAFLLEAHNLQSEEIALEADNIEIIPDNEEPSRLDLIRRKQKENIQNAKETRRD
ncbi:DDE-type integrase/transposase/recombinase [Planococcus sp. CPCC 101016]|uniref:Mu transposase C-terminal domain-containing protein n=1 Tax=Planococcus sp. CPCC 101016 TaxID=2599617 RepID=UPI0011B46451|nr:Mu transposase C-terminal domain-containing protein [Planococcus sp. CPCC 101016]TWT08192.1 DDE-type integrase/transposase/recombinase [Planococcus sp. CPCC 101016]